MKINKDSNIKKVAVSKNSEKKGDMLIQVNELMEKLESEYGPLMLGELQKRLIKTIEEFQEDVSLVLNSAFDKHKLKYEGVKSKLSSENESKEDIPSYISEYQKKQKK